MLSLTKEYAILGFEITGIDVLIILVGLSLIPLFLDVLNSFIPIGRIVHVYLSRVLVSILLSLYVTSLYVYFFMIIPYYFYDQETKTELSAVELFVIISATLFTFWLWWNTLFCYYCAIFQSPTIHNRLLVSPQLSSEFDDKDPRACLKCKIIKPPRTHHCRHCGVCILNMDHHCIFTGNCVSTGEEGNFVYFFMFIFYTFVGIVYACSTTISPFVNCFYKSEVSYRCEQFGSMSLILIPGITLFLAVGSFLFIHIILIVFGTSTIQALRWYHDKSNSISFLPNFSTHNNSHNDDNDNGGKDGEDDQLRANSNNGDSVDKLHFGFFYLLFPYFIPRTKIKDD